MWEPGSSKYKSNIFGLFIALGIFYAVFYIVFILSTVQN
ncbi:hypothetical protein FHR92_000656 [Fontibacillus solani]|uniref:Uncharacterized protein n=2 Tax=Fontibacillus TaxID=995014 RepID=A0A1G7J7F6_9BACL|nr:hypothetical protein [Fontibacillus solani]SDF20927.1 hypothetical protein SAMN04488542_10749 [Fontibacillus panacisegetis]